MLLGKWEINYKNMVKILPMGVGSKNEHRRKGVDQLHNFCSIFKKSRVVKLRKYEIIYISKLGKECIKTFNMKSKVEIFK